MKLYASNIGSNEYFTIDGLNKLNLHDKEEVNMLETEYTLSRISKLRSPNYRRIK